MIQASCPVSPGLVCPLEDLLCEMAPSNWSLVTNRLTGEGALVGYFDNEAEAMESWQPAGLAPSRAKRHSPTKLFRQLYKITGPYPATLGNLD